MPTITNDFITSPLGIDVFSPNSVKVNDTTVNIDTISTGTGTALTVEFTLPPFR